ncbi:SAM-dependent methyltransferase, partial [Curtobacterium citreum]
MPTVTTDPVVVAAIAADLDAAGFTVERVDALWGAEAAASLHRGTRVAALRALAARDTSPLTTLATLFVLGLPVARSDVERAFPTAGLDGVLAAGLLRTGDDGRVFPTVDLRPYAFVDDLGAGSWWIVSDLGELALGTALGEEHVLGIGGASTTLSGLQVPVRVRRVLDLGTGCGIQALHARRFADQVVATDISQRALDIARFNAALNGVDGIELRLGSLFEPVAGERFDRIVSNPPFVITPRREGVPSYEYRDGGMVGDALVE